MNAKLVVLFSCLLTTATLNQASASIIDTTTYGGHTYHLLDPKGWNESEAEAVSLGGHLITINSVEESIVMTGLKTVAMEYALAYLCGNCIDVPVWIGLNDSLLEGSFTWISGEPVTYTNWHLDEPSGSLPDEDYVAILGGVHWSDLLANASAGFPAGAPSDLFGPAFGIVEIGSSIPEPSTILLIGLGIAGLGWSCKRQKRGGG